MEEFVYEFKGRDHWGSKNIVYVKPPGGCWECTSHARNSAGYPMMSWKGKFSCMHRHIYSYEKDTVLDRDTVVRHTCDNKLCINPAHLIPGSHQDNSDDMVRRGRSIAGEDHHNSHLSDKECREIAFSLEPAAVLAVKYNTSVRQIYYIKIGKQRSRATGIVYKGANGRRHGEDHSMAKITADTARSIHDDPRPLKVIAEEMGLSVSSIRNVKKGITWAVETGHGKKSSAVSA